MAVANAPVLVTANQILKYLYRFKTGTQKMYRYSDIYLNISDVLIDSYLMCRIE